MSNTLSVYKQLTLGRNEMFSVLSREIGLKKN